MMSMDESFFPNLIIDQEITIRNHYKLKAIIWHHGQNLNSGHYTAMVKQRDQSWIHISDTKVINDIKVTVSSR